MEEVIVRCPTEFRVQFTVTINFIFISRLLQLLSAINIEDSFSSMIFVEVFVSKKSKIQFSDD